MQDTYLSSEYVFYLVRGLQEGEDSRYWKIVADCKHYAGYDVEQWHGNDRCGYNALISNLDLAETYLPPFKSCLKDAHVASAMCSYNAINGVPSCANAFLLNDVARGRWGWDGWIVSDCNALTCIEDNHHYVRNHSELVQVTLRSGTDYGCDTAIAEFGAAAVSEGMIEEADLDQALVRQFSSLVRLGYFDDASTQLYRQYSWVDVNTTEHRATALRAAHESVVLLKNDGGVLPLDAFSVRTIALIGPNADDWGAQLGNYAGAACELHTPRTALQSMAGVKVVYVKGVDVTGSDTSGFDAALAAAKAADAIVYVGGLNGTVENEAHDRETIVLPGQQLPLITALAGVGKPLVVMLFGGGGVDISSLRDSAAVPAILWHGYPSQFGGDALVDVLFGRYSPAGRLPVTWYPADYVDQVPMTDQSMRASANNPGRTYKSVPHPTCCTHPRPPSPSVPASARLGPLICGWLSCVSAGSTPALPCTRSATG